MLIIAMLLGIYIYFLLCMHVSLLLKTADFRKFIRESSAFHNIISKKKYFLALFYNFFIYFLWLRITDEGSYLYFNYLVSVTAGGPRSPRGHM